MPFRYAKFSGFLFIGALVASMLDTVVALVIGSVALVGGIILKLFFNSERKLFSLAVIAISIGFIAVGIQLRTKYYPSKALDNHSAEIVGIVTEVSSDSGKSYYTVKTESIDLADAPQKITLQLGTWGDNYIPLNYRIKCRVKFSAIGGESLSELFENRSRGISVYAYTETSVVVLGEGKKGIDYFFAVIREYLSEKLNSIYYGETNAMMKRLLLGYRSSSLSNSIISSFRRAGMSHILVVSGMHLAIIMSIFEKLLKIKKARGNALTLKILFLMLIIVLYMAVAGFGFSVRRAGFMLMFYYFARLFRSRSASIDNLGFAVIMVILINPLSACDIGFMMSAMSTAAIITMSSKIRYVLYHSIEIKNRSLRTVFGKLVTAFSVSLCAWIITVPISAFTYGKISLVAPFSNILGSIIAETIISLGMLSLFVSIVPFALPIAKVIGSLVVFFEYLLKALADFFGNLPFAEVSTEQKWVTVYIIGVALLFVVPWLWKKSLKYSKYVAVMSIFLLLSGVLAEQLIFRDITSTEITVLKEGTAITCSKGDYSVLITKGYSDGDSYRLKTTKTDALLCIGSENEAVEMELCNKMKPKLALTDNEWVEYFGESTLINSGALELWDDGSIVTIGNAIEIDTGDILILYIFGECDIMNIEPRFRKADIIILEGVSPNDFSVLRSSYMVLRDFGGYYSGTEELIVLKNDSVSFCSKNKNIRKGWDFF